MRYLILGDVHANLEALDAVLEDAPAHDAVICLGDMVGYGASPNQSLHRVLRLSGLVILAGNHDLAALKKLDLNAFNDNARRAALWTGRELTPENRALLESLQPSTTHDGIFLAHASPRDPIWEYMEDTFQGLPNFRHFREAVCFVGHTHVPKIYALDESSARVSMWIPNADSSLQLEDGIRYIVNPGGVGQPRDRDPRAAYAIFDTDARALRFHRVPYDIESAQRRIVEAGLPPVLAARLSIGV